MLSTFTHQGLTFSYSDNRAAGPVLVFQHGLTGDHQQTRQSYTAEDCRLITLECRSHGGTAQGDEAQLGIIPFASDLSALLDHLEIEQAHFAGISMGAAIVARFAAQQPQRVSSLTLVRPAWHQRRSPANMVPFALAADYLHYFPVHTGLEAFRQCGLFTTLAALSPDNASALEALFSKEVDPQLLRRLVLCDPGFDSEALRALPVSRRVVGCAEDEIHPLALAQAVAADLHVSCDEITAKSRDKAAYFAELTAILQQQIHA
ncbi:alpha/beta fold hydrolase [Erwinia rhapontici]|uniref:alpha/beta fold hydrolase n=1 Tax=Erwinia rhapontici TaxID=55212 RepID=UPI003D36489B